MNSKIRQSWEGFLNPEITRPHLIAASIYIAGFEILKDSIVGRVRNFFWTGFDESSEKIDPKYQSEILARNRSPVYASMDWLKEMRAIDDSDVKAFGRVKTCRNTLAHELFSMLISKGLPQDFEQCFSDMVALLRKIEVWWIINIEIPTNPDFDDKEVDEDGIVTGPVMGMQLLMDIALGDEERSKFYYDEFRKQTIGG
jgi:hypothetical protein